jgi:arylsulfatase A-like enzyme
MRRRDFLGAMSGAAFGQSGRRRPNVIFILADDLGWGDTGCYGSRAIRTPYIDRLASQGKLFTQFYANAPVCSPSRCGLLTGRFPGSFGLHSALEGTQNKLRGQPEFIDPSVFTVARALRGAGYATAHFGKWHLGQGPGAPSPGDYGFDEHSTTSSNDHSWDERAPFFRANSTELLVDETLRFIGRRRGDPFYVNLWALLPHATLNPTPEQMAPYERFGPGKEAPHKGAMQIYYATVTALDAGIGRLLSKLDDLGLADDTLIVLSSDNGPEDIHISNASHSGVGSTGPFRGRKRSLYEGGIRMPFIVRLPGRIADGSVDERSVVSGVDFLPTVAAMTGTPLPAGLSLDGEDRSAVLLGGPAARSRPLYWEWRLAVVGDLVNQSPRLAARAGDWKLLMNPDRSRVELYDIPRDSLELNNLAGAQPAVVDRLAKPLLAWQQSLPQGPVAPAAGRNNYPWPRAGKQETKP